MGEVVFFFLLGSLWVHSVWLLFDGWQAGAGVEMQVQHNVEHLHLRLGGEREKKKTGIKIEKPKQNGTASVLCV